MDGRGVTFPSQKIEGTDQIQVGLWGFCQEVNASCADEGERICLQWRVCWGWEGVMKCRKKELHPAAETAKRKGESGPVDQRESPPGGHVTVSKKKCLGKRCLLGGSPTTHQFLVMWHEVGWFEGSQWPRKNS